MDSNERFEIRRVASHDGTVISVRSWGREDAMPVLFLHGGGQTSWAWETSARRLAVRGFHCLAPDFRGHGESGWAGEDGYDLDHFVDDARAVVEQLCDQPPVAVGASLGGVTALVLEGESTKQALAGLALVDITPRWESEGVARILDFLAGHPDGFASVDEAAGAVTRYLPHRRRSSNPEGLRRNLRRGDNGRWFWHWDPAMLRKARLASEDWPPRLEQAARRITVPTLLISGGRSDVVSEDTIQEFLDLVPHAEHRDIADAHHMVAGDSNDQFTQTILDFLGQAPFRLTA